MIDDSEALGTPHEAFCRIVEVNHPENPGLGKKVTGPHWHYEFPPGPDALAIGNALGFLNANVSAGKISAQGIRKGTEHDGPKPINTAELRIGILNVWDGTLVCQTNGEGARLFRDVFLSMADLNRELGIPPVKGTPKPTMAKSSAKLATGADFKFDWDGALIEVMAFLQQNPLPPRPGPIVKVMQEWFTDQPSGEPQREPLYERARRILARMKSIE
jgi:hypothetical protein